MTPRLETARLVLRPVAADDWDVVGALLSDPLTIRYMHFVIWTPAQRRAWFEQCVAQAQQPGDDELVWAITQKDTGEVIGYCSSEPSQEHTAAIAGERVVGYALTRSSWGHGYMTEALRAVLADEFDVRGAPAIRATCNVANPASARVMEKAGMRREKTVFDANFAGSWTYWHHYTITKAEYAARR